MMLNPIQPTNMSLQMVLFFCVLLQIPCLELHCLSSLPIVMTFLLRQFLFVVQQSWRNDCKRRVCIIRVSSSAFGLVYFVMRCCQMCA